MPTSAPSHPELAPVRPARRRCRLRRPRRTTPGFTLVELLVVVGLIALLVGLLLPTLARSREQARRAACLSNVRQLTAAVMVYLVDNRHTLPDAGSANVPLEAPLSPRAVGAPPGTTIPDSFGMIVLPSIGASLRPTLGASPAPWRCPAAPQEAFRFAGDDPFAGHRAPDEFLPHYSYVAGKEILETAAAGGPVADQFRLRTWATRSVAGLRAAKAVPRGQTSAQVVLFHDRDSSFHARGRKNIYTERADWTYYASYGFLDGHAEGRTYRNADEYVAQLHRAIPQQWYGRDFEATFPEQYAP